MTRCVKCYIVADVMANDGGEKDKAKLHKVIGTGLGWVVAGPVGAAIGFLAGRAVEKNPELLEKGLLGGRLKASYDVLQLPYDAGAAEVKAAYKRLAHKYHPDRFAGTDAVIQELAKGKMADINEAYGKIIRKMKAQTREN